MSDWFDAEQRAERAAQLTESRRWAEALAELEAALEINPANTSWLAQRGFLLDQLDRLPEAIESYESALAAGEPDDREILLALGIDLSRVGRLSESLTTFERLNQLYPDFEPGYCYQIMTCAELEQHDKAEVAFYLAQQLRADCPHCFYHIGHSLADRGDYQRAIHCWQRVLELEPEYDNVTGQMARAFRAMRDVEKAKEFYLTAIREDPGDVNLLYEMGDLLAECGDIEGATTKFRQVVELAPDHAEGYRALGQVLLASNETEKALACLDRVRSLDPEADGLSFLYGSANLKLGRYTEACTDLEAAVEANPTNVDALMLYGNCLLWMRRPQDAGNQFRRIIALDASLASAHHNLGVCCFLQEEYERGVEHCRKAIELKPDYVLAVVKAALALQKLGRFGEARRMIEYGLGIDAENAFLQQLRDQLWRARLRYVLGWPGRFIARFRAGRDDS